MTVNGRRKAGRSKKTWAECIKDDIKARGLGSVDPMDREEWRARVRGVNLLPSTSECEG